MEMKPLGSSGLRVSAVGLGCMNFGLMCDQNATNDIVDAAIDAGVNFFDVADIYGGPHGKAETLLGKALGGRRQQIILATKFGAKSGGGGGAAENGGSADYILKAMDESLQRLGTDYVDLYQHHFPDKGTPVEETLRALETLVRSGKVRHIGCSNYTGAMLEEALGIAATAGIAPFVTAQNRYSLITRDIEKDLVPICRRHHVGVLPYFPLESGLLSGKYHKDQALPEGSRFAKWRGGGIFASAAGYAAVEKLEQYGARTGRSVLDLAIGWLAEQDFVASVIAGVTRPEQIRQNVAAASWKAAPGDLAEIARLAVIT